MTKQEAKQIPDLNIMVTDIIEDCFYLKLFLNGKLSVKEGRNVSERLHRNYAGREMMAAALDTADIMVENLHKYGVACAEWCE